MLSVLDEGSVPLPLIFGLSGEKLEKEEKKFFAEANPLGFILFARNCQNPGQLRSLTDSLRDCMGRDIPILIDQEGGRVMRLKPPHWQDRASAQVFGDLFTRNFTDGLQEVNANAAAIANDLADAGVNVNCAPVLDVSYPQTHGSIGDRAFSNSPHMAGVLGAYTCRMFLQCGIVPVVKHMPGQGRAEADSHNDLPVVAATLDEMEASDFVPFKEVLTKAYSEAMWGMVAHVVYKSIDDKLPASCSRRVIWDVIRHKIGFQGLLLSDDINMKALEEFGNAAQRAKSVLKAGCDIALHCNGEMDEMQLIAEKIQPMSAKAVERFNTTARWLEQNKT